MILSLIAAIGKNNELGKGNTLLWHMPADMKHFKETTMGHSVIMGRKTFESIGKPLPNRKNIIITRDKDYRTVDAWVVNSLEDALRLFAGQNEEVFVIGGADIYKQTMEMADKLYITHVDAEDPEADAFFPEIVPIAWNEVRHEEHSADDNNPHKYTFSVYEKFQ